MHSDSRPGRPVRPTAPGRVRALIGLVVVAVVATVSGPDPVTAVTDVRHAPSAIPFTGVWSSDPMLGRSGQNVPRGTGTVSVLDEASGMVPSRYDDKAFLVANQYSIVRFRPLVAGSTAAVTQRELYRGSETQFEAMARGDAPVTHAPDRVLAFQATDAGERSRLVVFSESVTDGGLTREASYALRQNDWSDLPNVEAVLFEPSTQLAWFFTKNEHPTRIFRIDFSKRPIWGVYRASSWVGQWRWEIDVPISGTDCQSWSRVPIVPTDIHLDMNRHRTMVVVGNQRYGERTAAVLATFRRPSDTDWRDIGAHRSWRRGQVQFGNGRDACFPYDFGGLGVEAVSYRGTMPTTSGLYANVVMIQDNTDSNQIGSRVIQVP